MVKKKSRGKPLGTRKTSSGIGTRLVGLRMLKGWSQSDASDRIGISPAALRAMETGDKFGLLEELLVRVADVYGVSMDQIYGRSESAIERFATASVEVQGAQLDGIMSAIARLTQNPEVLSFIDELVSMLGNELPDWTSIQKFREMPSQERMTKLQQAAMAIARLARDRTAINYIGALVLQFAGKEFVPRGAYSLAREEQSLVRTLSEIDRIFGRTAANRDLPMTPSRYKVTEEPAPSAEGGKPSKARKKKVARVKKSTKPKAKKAAKKK